MTALNRYMYTVHELVNIIDADPLLTGTVSALKSHQAQSGQIHTVHYMLYNVHVHCIQICTVHTFMRIQYTFRNFLCACIAYICCCNATDMVEVFWKTLEKITKNC